MSTNVMQDIDPDVECLIAALNERGRVELEDECKVYSTLTTYQLVFGDDWRISVNFKPLGEGVSFEVHIKHRGRVVTHTLSDEHNEIIRASIEAKLERKHPKKRY